MSAFIFFTAFRFQVLDSRFEISYFGARYQDSVPDTIFPVSAFTFRVSGISDFKLQISDFGFQVSTIVFDTFRFQVSDSRFQVSYARFHISRSYILHFRFADLQISYFRFQISNGGERWNASLIAPLTLSTRESV